MLEPLPIQLMEHLFQSNFDGEATATIFSDGSVTFAPGTFGPNNTPNFRLESYGQLTLGRTGTNNGTNVITISNETGNKGSWSANGALKIGPSGNPVTILQPDGSAEFAGDVAIGDSSHLLRHDW